MEQRRAEVGKKTRTGRKNMEEEASRKDGTRDENRHRSRNDRARNDRAKKKEDKNKKKTLSLHDLDLPSLSTSFLSPSLSSLLAAFLSASLVSVFSPRSSQRLLSASTLVPVWVGCPLHKVRTTTVAPSLATVSVCVTLPRSSYDGKQYKRVTARVETRFETCSERKSKSHSPLPVPSLSPLPIFPSCSPSFRYIFSRLLRRYLRVSTVPRSICVCVSRSFPVGVSRSLCVCLTGYHPPKKEKNQLEKCSRSTLSSLQAVTLFF